MINDNLNTKSRVTSWIATSVSPGWIRGCLLLDIRLLIMHYYSIVYSLCSSIFEATNHEKSNDKRLSAPAPFLICSTTCVWSLKSGGYGGEGRRLMSIYPTTILQPPFFRNWGGTKFLNWEPAVWSSLDKKLRRVWRKLEEMSIYSQLQSFKPLSVFFFHKLRRHEIFNFWSGSGSLIITKLRRVWRKLKEMIIEHIANYNPSISFLPTLLKARN